MTVKRAVFLSGGRFDGDRASIPEPLPPVLAVVPCDCTPAGDEEPCGMASHWHDPEEADRRGDMPRNPFFYVLARTRERPRKAALYQYAGQERPRLTMPLGGAVL